MNTEEDEFRRIEREAKRRAQAAEDDDTQGYVSEFALPQLSAADELRRLQHNNFVLTNALWKACGDDKNVVNATIKSQGELK
jgi:hypothetical protein